MKRAVACGRQPQVLRSDICSHLFDLVSLCRGWADLSPRHESAPASPNCEHGGQLAVVVGGVGGLGVGGTQTNC